MQNLDDILKRTVDSVRHAVESDDVIGKPVLAADGSVILPVNKLSYGFAVGGGEYGNADGVTSEYPYSAVCGGGVTLTPVGFLICGREKRFVSVDKAESGSKWIDLLKSVTATLKQDE